MADDIVILDGARTAIGTFGGSLAATPPIDLGATVAKAALERAKAAAADDDPAAQAAKRAETRLAVAVGSR